MAGLAPLTDRYLPVRLVGEGATGAVYEVEDRHQGGRVALKAIRANLAVHARFRARFAHEVALSARVSHPRIVPVLDHGALSDGRPFVVLALADQGSLDDRLKTGLPLREALRLVDQALDALAYLHARGYLHQDLKPGNLLLHADGARSSLWVADLGVADSLASLAIDRRGISGTPVWMAPEQLGARSQELGPWTDLYAVGLVLLAMLGGLPPEELEARNPGELLSRRNHLQVRLRPELPPALGEVLRNLLDPEPRQRYDRAADVRRALRDAVGGLSPELRVSELPRQTVPASRTTFPDEILPEGQAPIIAPRARDRVSIRWNRVPPDPMPAPVPPEPPPDPRVRTSLGLLGLRELPMVGRQEQRQRLWSLATAVARSSAPQVALVIGAAGAGKTRLVESVSEALDQHGYMEVVTLRYHLPPGDFDGYRGAVRELLAPWNETRSQTEERLVRWLAREWQQSSAAVAGEAASLTRWCGSLREGEAPVHAAAGLSYLYRTLDARAWRSGAALVLDDAHLAQAAGDGLAICEALLRRTVGQRPVFAMATLSAEALASNPALAAQVDDLVALGAVRIDVPPLPTDEVRYLLADACRLEPGLAAAIAPRCFGSPSFAVLLLRDLATRGALSLQPDATFGLPPRRSGAEIVPGDIEGLAERRMDGALSAATDPDAAEEALMVLALAGQEPPTLVVRAACPPGGLDALLATGLVRQRGWQLVFEHTEVQRAAWRLAERSPATPELHRRLAEAWAGLARRTGTDVDLPLGLHRLHADQPTEALGPLLRAARKALFEGRPAAALDAAHFAAVAADRLDGSYERYEARCLQTEALLELERTDDAITLITQTRKLPRLADRDNAHLQVLLARAAIHKGSLEQAWKLLEMAEACYTLLRDRPGQAETAQGFGRLYRLRGEQDEAVRRYQQVMDLRPGDLRAEVEARKEIIECCIALGQAGGLETEVQRMNLAAQRSGDTRCIASATYAAGLLRLHHGQLNEAEAHLRTARALAATLGADVLDLLCQQRLGALLVARQDDAGALAVFDAAARFAEDRGWGDSAAVTHLQMALIALRHSAEHRVIQETDRANHLLQAWPQHWAWALVGVLRALAAARAGDVAATAAWWQVAWERLSGRLATAEFGLALQLLAGIAHRRGWTRIEQQARVMSRQVIGISLLPDDDPSQVIELPPPRTVGSGDDTMSRTRPTIQPPPAPPPGEDVPPIRGRAGSTWLPDDDEPEETPTPKDEAPRRTTRGSALPESDIATDEVPTRRR